MLKKMLEKMCQIAGPTLLILRRWYKPAVLAAHCWLQIGCYIAVCREMKNEAIVTYSRHTHCYALVITRVKHLVITRGTGEQSSWKLDQK